MSSWPDTRVHWKILYGFMFVVILPVGLLLWARAAEPGVSLPVPASIAVGIAVALAGIAIMITGMSTLMLYGKGLPMSAFPPPKYVQRGIYRLVPHPIYIGFTLLCAGSAVALESSAGLWLVSPIVLLGSTALVQGFEKHDLQNRFGPSIAQAVIHLPSSRQKVPTVAERLSVYLLLFVPWLALYEAIAFLGTPADAVVVYLPFEKNFPVYEWTELFYGSTYVFVLLVPLVATSSRDLREFTISGLTATAGITLLFVLVPFIAPPREFTPHGFPGALLMWERAHDTPAAAFPSFHVVWAFLAAHAYSKARPSSRALWWLWASLIAVSCVTTGMHGIIDVVGGALVVPFVLRTSAVWQLVRGLTERIANSWKERHIGPVRIINHGIYAGLGSAIGLSLIGILLGPEYFGPMLIVGFSGLIIAGLWAQYFEGSPTLLRPFGYYGSVVGVFLGSPLAHLFGGDIWLLLCAFAAAGPFIQAAGRLRCLVQGCCHGREAPPSVGIRYLHPRSRVFRLANLTNVPIHPTPLYSIMWNFLIGVFLLRLWSLHVSVTLIGGLYLILNGLGRFVEESYRGEPQTPFVGKLRLYQVIAIVSILVGAVITTVSSAPAPAAQFNWPAVVGGFIFGLACWFALGVDFPNSNRRFARLV